jgi:hypothetical protein
LNLQLFSDVHVLAISNYHSLRKLLDPQQIIIVVCVCLAMMLSVVSRRLVGNGRQWTLLLAACGLFAVAGYESYMSFIWEKTVSAPISLKVKEG